MFEIVFDKEELRRAMIKTLLENGKRRYSRIKNRILELQLELEETVRPRDSHIFIRTVRRNKMTYILYR